MVPTEFKVLIQRFYALQTERIETYRLFEEQLVHEITQAFLGISRETAMLQMARQRAQDHPEEEGCQEKIQDIKQDLIKNQAILAEIMQDFKYDSEECD
ncbi:hypothetical protein CRUP_022781 [Coryphaenoides rupestris]|nr:hypothetical protein CRUP_022781 [Coryphaenoides rupestris]